ncbi:hypothetical protein INS49_005232 [Diaporthe citri]|uniref:uncharacterized protein n=1 Tax=Diaporthe citri TaxID=83186 RepID=UPI001C8257D3|nr:uncharacterized protein INS49_005232 [Diaporthe citri]KAG6353756.1 hypothetical protein INS49_005232 [Diaporthe citri]
MRPCIGTEESEEVRVVRSASTIDRLWRDLVGYANDNWISQKLAPSLGLEHQQLFDKREATAEDILLILKTLWERGSDIRCKPDVRVSFNAALVIAAIGGFRMGVVKDLEYRQVQLGFVRVNGRLEPVATISLLQNKRKENAIRKSQNELVSISVTVVPYKLVCVLSLIVARALAADAFEVHFDSFEQFLTRPRLEGNVNYFPVKWKDEFLEKPIFPVSYMQFWRLWKDAVHVAGIRDPPRPYAVRVGAGARINSNP